MTITENENILQRRIELVDGMTGYMIDCAINSEFGAGYTQTEIDRSGLILDDFLTALDDETVPADPEKIAGVVKRPVLALNGLNSECDGSLIETDQREHVCDILLWAANEAGLDTDEDVTEQWRGW